MCGLVSGPGEPSPQSRQISAIKKGGCPRAYRWVCITSRQITANSITRNEVNAMVIGAVIARAGSAKPDKLDMYKATPTNIPSTPMVSST
jgi:hypothetical protein